MTTLDLAQAIASQKDCDPSLIRWSQRVRLSLAQDLIYLARSIDGLPADLQQQYWDALREVVSSIPDDVQLSVSSPLFQTLKSLAPTDFRDALLNKVYVMQG
ncbi:MAG: hypothetical protein O2822_08535 [Chloroflexi bacterium]|nr:hypothetical protein [Chloroflexota bacterium]